eukprot:gene16154-21895_t
MGLVSSTSFKTIVDRHSGDYKANANKMYHLGIGEVVPASSICRANENRSFQIYEDLAMLLIMEARQQYLHDDGS